MTVNPGQGMPQVPGMTQTPAQQPNVANNAWAAGGTTANSTVSTTTTFPAGMNVQAIIADFYNKKPEDVKILSQALKNANYQVKVTSKPNPDLLQTYLKAQADFRILKNAAPAAPVNDIYSYLAFVDQTGQGAGGTAVSKSKSTRLVDDTTAAALVNAVFEDQVGRKASAKEIAKYTASLRKAQATAPTTTTTTTTAGDGMTSSSSQTTGGINEQQFLIQQIGGSDEAKAKQVFDFYSAFKSLLGVQ